VRALAVMAMAVGMLIGGVTPAWSHAGLVPGEISPTEPQDAQVVLAHGCGEDGGIPPNEEEAEAISTVTLAVPSPLRITPQEVEGWTLTVDEGATGEVEVARWDNDAPEGAAGAVLLDVIVDATELSPGDEMWLPVTQECVDGTSMSWDHAGPPVTLEDLPAMALRTTPAAAESSPSGGLPTPIVISLAVALAVVAGGVVMAVSGRRVR
jgi:uncharacterized protein YcnI